MIHAEAKFEEANFSPGNIFTLKPHQNVYPPNSLTTASVRIYEKYTTFFKLVDIVIFSIYG
jgi:hypothetical protein